MHFDRAHGLMLVQATLDGHAAVLMIDNGATTSLIDRSFADRHGIVTTPDEGTIHTPTGSMGSAVTRPVTLTLVDQVTRAGPMFAVDLSQVSALLGRPIDGVLGADVLSRSALVIVPDKGILFIVPSGSVHLKGHTMTVPLSADYAIETTVDGHPVKVRIDLGDNSLLSLDTDAFDAIVPEDAATTGGYSAHADGERMEEKQAKVGRMKLGSWSVTDFPVKRLGYALADGDGRLGTVLFSHFEALFDPHAGVLAIVNPATKGTGDDATEDREDTD